MSVTESKSSSPLPSAARVKASGPILILALLFVFAVCLSWYFTWFGRGLSDADISKYLNDEKHPRHVQHALLQIQQRIEKGDATALEWYPRIVELAGNPETEFRLTVAWLMGSDNRSEEFHRALTNLLRDREPIVRRNAALALLRFKDPSGREELLAILLPYVLKAPESGTVVSTLKEGSVLARGTLLARLQNDSRQLLEVRSPLPGKLHKLAVQNGSRVTAGDAVLEIASDEESTWEALRGLALVGEASDLSLMQRLADPNSEATDKIKQQAKLTIASIQQRSGKGE
jgi:hypothetical protein